MVTSPLPPLPPVPAYGAARLNVRHSRIVLATAVVAGLSGLAIPAMAASPGHPHQAGSSLSGTPGHHGSLFSGTYRPSAQRLSGGPVSALPSGPSAPTAPLGFTLTRKPVAKGPAVVGKVLAVRPATLVPTPSTVTFQWMRGGTSIHGATHQRYTPSRTDQGKTISVRVTFTRSGYQPLVVTDTVGKTHHAHRHPGHSAR